MSCSLNWKCFEIMENESKEYNFQNTISKTIHFGLITSIPAFIIEQLNIIKKTLFG